MAITRAQQVKQMLREGGRIGFKGKSSPDVTCILLVLIKVTMKEQELMIDLEA